MQIIRKNKSGGGGGVEFSFALILKFFMTRPDDTTETSPEGSSEHSVASPTCCHSAHNISTASWPEIL